MVQPGAQKKATDKRYQIYCVPALLLMINSLIHITEIPVLNIFPDVSQTLSKSKTNAVRILACGTSLYPHRENN